MTQSSLREATYMVDRARRQPLNFALRSYHYSVDVACIIDGICTPERAEVRADSLHEAMRLGTRAILQSVARAADGRRIHVEICEHCPFCGDTGKVLRRKGMKPVPRCAPGADRVWKSCPGIDRYGARCIGVPVRIAEFEVPMPEYTLDGEPIDLQEFLDANPRDDNPEVDPDEIRALAPGGVIFYGGGAQPRAVLRRVR